MTLRLGNITLDCDDTMAVAAFWAAALGRDLDQGASQWFASIGMGGPGPRWFFIKVPEAKTTKNRQHIDYETDDRLGEVERLVALGASEIGDKDEHGHQWTVMTDIEGNEFCVSGTH